MKKKYWDLASGIVLLAFSVALFIASGKVKTLGVSSIGSGFFPSVVAVLILLVSVGIIVGGIQKARGPDAKPAADADKPRMLAVLATFALMAAYALLIAPVGFLITTTVYIFVQIQLLSPNTHRKHLMFGIISVVSSTVIYFTFVKVFNLMLPAGLLG